MEFVKIVHAVFSKRISKVLFCLLCFLGIGMGAYSQDVIVKKDGEEIKSKVMEVSGYCSQHGYRHLFCKSGRR